MDRGVEERALLLERARGLQRTGRVAEAWLACQELAASSRAGGDAPSLADAALVIEGGAPSVKREVHALAQEALVRLAGSDPARARRLRAQLVATADPFLAEDHGDHDADVDAEELFLELQVRETELRHVTHVRERLAIGDETVGLGLRAGRPDIEAWGRRWRLDAYAELGMRVELVSELVTLSPLAAGLGSEWRCVLLLAQASHRLLEGRFAEAARLADEALEVGGERSTASYFHTVFAFAIARMTGDDLEAVEQAVRREVADLPYLAKGWLCLALSLRDQREEGMALWASLVPHVQRMPERAPEWLLAVVGYAEICEWLGDTATAGILLDQLVPWSGLHAIGHAHAPYNGPVDLALGRLCRLLGRADEARGHLREALRQCEEIQATPHVALAREQLALLEGVTTKVGREHAEIGLRLARRLGMRPLVDRVAGMLAVRPDGPSLTPREREVTELVARGLTNGAIAAHLTLSERTVENHVSRILHKLDLPTRTALAVWSRDHGRGSPGL